MLIYHPVFLEATKTSGKAKTFQQMIVAMNMCQQHLQSAATVLFPGHRAHHPLVYPVLPLVHPVLPLVHPVLSLVHPVLLLAHH